MYLIQPKPTKFYKHVRELSGVLFFTQSMKKTMQKLSSLRKKPEYKDKKYIQNYFDIFERLARRYVRMIVKLRREINLRTKKETISKFRSKMGELYNKIEDREKEVVKKHFYKTICSK
jgi:hypothetical protein